MSRFTMRSRGVVALAATAALASVLVPGASAQKVIEAGPFVINPTAGSMSLGATEFDLSPRDLPQCSDGFDNDADNQIDAADNGCATGPNGEPKSSDDSEAAGGFQPKQEVELSGSIDTDGHITVPTSGVQFPTIYIPIDIAGYKTTARADVVATHPAVGTLDPITGAADLRVRLKVNVSASIQGVSTGYYCSIGTGANPIDINLTTGMSTAPNGSKIYGAPYRLPQGSLTVVSNNFSVPGASTCGDAPFYFLNDIINSQIGIPSAKGNSKVILSGTVNPAPQPAVVASATATPPSGPAPHEVTLDASASTVAAQPATYEWTFPDGSVESGAVVNHTFADQGTKVVKLRVSDADGDSDSRLLLIEVGAGSATTTTTTTTQPTTTTTTTQPTTTTTTTQPTTTTTTTQPTTTTTTTQPTTTTTTTQPTTTTTTTQPTTTTTTTQPTRPRRRRSRPRPRRRSRPRLRPRRSRPRPRPRRSRSQPWTISK